MNLNVIKLKNLKVEEISDSEIANKDILIDQLKDHIKEMEKNEEIFERLNKKFINLQNE